MTDEYPQLTEAEQLQSARDWAESIQKRFAEELSAGIARDDSPPSERASAYGKLVEQLVIDAGIDPSFLEPTNVPERLSEFDEPHVRELIEGHLASLAAANLALGMKPADRKIIASSVPSGAINAFCCSNTWDENFYHVFFDADIVVFTNVFSKIVSTCLIRASKNPASSGREIREAVNVALSPPIINRIQDLFGSYVFHGFARASAPWLPKTDVLPLHANLSISMSRFAVAHELGHVLLGHISSTDQSITVRSDSLKDADAIVYSHAAEFDADQVGTILSSKCDIDRGAYNPVIVCAPYFFMSALAVLASCLGEASSDSETLLSTHPAARDRVKYIRSSLLEAYKVLGFEKNLASILDEMDVLLRAISDIAVTHVDARRAAGETPRLKKKLFAADDRPAILGMRASGNDSAKSTTELLTLLRT